MTDRRTLKGELADAVLDIFPALVALVPIGLVFGAVAVIRGMSPLEATLASALMFSGGAQLAALELWRYPVPMGALVLSTLLINLRFLLMSASLAQKLPRLPWFARFVGLHALADENWALCERRASREMAAGRRISAAYLFGMAWLFWSCWVLCTWIGTQIGPFLGDPKRLGADFAFAAIFIGLIVGFARSRQGVAVVVASAVSAAIAYRTFGAPWHIVAGTVAGLVMAALTADGVAERAVVVEGPAP
jgi:predicted branched-subunit amino acid permease